MKKKTVKRPLLIKFTVKYFTHATITKKKSKSNKVQSILHKATCKSQTGGNY